MGVVLGVLSVPCGSGAARERGQRFRICGDDARLCTCVGGGGGGGLRAAERAAAAGLDTPAVLSCHIIAGG